MTIDIQTRLTKLSACHVGSRLSADVLVVQDIAKPGTRNLWIAVLLGLPIVSCVYIMRQTGPAIVYQAAIARALNVCMTTEFRRSFPMLSHIIDHVLTKPQRRWRRLSDVPARGGAKLLVFATPGETSRGRIPRACSPAVFLRRLGKPTAMAMGACGI